MMNGRPTLVLISMGVILCAAPLFGKTHRGEGLVLAVDRQHETATISHKEIPGYMPAMAMEFRVAKGELLAGLRPGMRVRFSARVVDDEAVIENFTVLRADPLESRASAPPAGMPRLNVGDTVPPFRLIAQDGTHFDFNPANGRLRLLQFIYTRCPVADVCPRLSANFAYLQKKFGPTIELISVTLDPKWDTPARLAEYAERWRADTHNWKFLTGTDGEIRTLASRFGVLYWAEDGALTHSSVVAMIGPDGRVLAELEGSAYPVTELADLVSVQLARRDVPVRRSGNVEHGS